jgi:hypothetical protein
LPGAGKVLAGDCAVGIVLAGVWGVWAWASVVKPLTKLVATTQPNTRLVMKNSPRIGSIKYHIRRSLPDTRRLYLWLTLV